MTNPACPHCGVDVLKAGFIVKETRYQAYARVSGQIMRSHSAKSAIETFHCMPCNGQLYFDPRKLLKEAAAA